MLERLGPHQLVLAFTEAIYLGRLEQVAPSQDIYLGPATTFVAGCIGSPGMNFLPARTEAGGERPTIPLSAGQQRLYCTGERPVLVGIRPEHFRLARPEGRPVQATVIEPLGFETLVYATPDGVPIGARLPPDRAPAAGTRLAFSVRPEHVCLADPETGRIVA